MIQSKVDLVDRGSRMRIPSFRTGYLIFRKGGQTNRPRQVIRIEVVSARQAHRLNKEWGYSPVGINIRLEVRLAPQPGRNQIRKGRLHYRG